MVQVALVCGASGFVGRYAIQAFAAAGWKVVGASRTKPTIIPPYLEHAQGDLNDAGFVTGLLDGFQPDRVLFAAGPSNVQQSFSDPLSDYKAQMLPLFQILDCSRKQARPPGVLLISSAAVYGNPTCLPVSEETETRPISPYGYHKLHQERLLDEFAALYGLPTCTTRLFSTFGVGLRRLAVWEIAARALCGDYKLRGTGLESRDYLEITDVGRALACVATAAPFAGEIVNIASGTETTIADLAKEVYRGLDIIEIPKFDGQELAGSPIRWSADVERLRALRFTSQMSFATGIAQTVSWIKTNA